MYIVDSQFNLTLKNMVIGVCLHAETTWLSAGSEGEYYYKKIIYNKRAISVPIKKEGAQTGLIKDEDGRLWLIAEKNNIYISMPFITRMRSLLDGNNFFIVRPVLLPQWSVSYLESNGVEIPIVNPKRWQIMYAGELPDDYFDGHYNVYYAAFTHSLFFRTLVQQFNEYPDKLNVIDSINNFIMYILQNELPNQSEVVFQVIRSINVLRSVTKNLEGNDPTYVEEIYKRLHRIENSVVDYLIVNNIELAVENKALFTDSANSKISKNIDAMLTGMQVM